jgi:hypothetical protein
MKESTFAAALSQVQFPAAVGDITLRYETSLFIGETRPKRATWWPIMALSGGLFFAVLVLVGTALRQRSPVLLVCVAATAMCFGAHTWLRRHQRERRRFVLNFAMGTLRLDFASSLLLSPKTVVVPFDRVVALERLQVDEEQQALVLELKELSGQSQHFREVLVASVPSDEYHKLDTLEVFLRNAFGLGYAVGAGQYV